MRPSDVGRSRARAEIVRTSGGWEVLLAVISEGQVGAHAGEAAQLVLEHIFHVVAQHEGRDMNEALRRGFESGARALEARRERWGSETDVGVTAAAVRHGHIYYASAGGPGFYLVADGECRPIEPRRSLPLSPVRAASVRTGPKEGLRFDSEAQLIIASSSVVADSPEDGRPYVELKDIPGYVSGNPPMEAARHLISIALGRDVPEDISVIVLQATGRRKPARAILAILVALVVIASLIAVGDFAVRRLASTIPSQAYADYGYAVLVDGDILMQSSDASQAGPIRLQRLETIPAGSRILAQVDSRLGVQTTFEGPSDLSSVSLHLSAGSIVQLSWLDLRDGETDGQGAPVSTMVTLDSGAILLRRGDGSRWTQIRSGDTTAAFSPPGPAALAVVADANETLIECLVGGCVLQIGQQPPVFIDAPGRVEVRNGAAGEVGSLSEDDILTWNALCGDCLEIQP